ncbi:hypothetical protein SARC_16379, partial [Sphaeroforma arctica JP610]
MLEIWNVVLMEYNQTHTQGEGTHATPIDGSSDTRSAVNADGKHGMQKLAYTCVDTGMGLERLASVLQYTDNNYNIDTFLTIVNAVKRLPHHESEARVHPHPQERGLEPTHTPQGSHTYTHTPEDSHTHRHTPVHTSEHAHTLERSFEEAAIARDLQNATEAPYRIIADHLRASAILIGDGVLPSNQNRGYVLRRIIRRACLAATQVGVQSPFMER